MLLIECVEPFEARDHLIPDPNLPGKSSEFSGDLAARLEPEFQHSHHPYVDHEFNGGLVHQGARCRAKHSPCPHPGRFPGPQGFIHSTQWTTTDIQY